MIEGEMLEIRTKLPEIRINTHFFIHFLTVIWLSKYFIF